MHVEYRCVTTDKCCYNSSGQCAVTPKTHFKSSHITKKSISSIAREMNHRSHQVSSKRYFRTTWESAQKPKTKWRDIIFVWCNHFRFTNFKYGNRESDLLIPNMYSFLTAYSKL